jgi:hypothetical protein
VTSPSTALRFGAVLPVLVLLACGGQVASGDDGGALSTTTTDTVDASKDGASSASPVTWPACEGTVAAACSGDNTCFKTIDVATDPATWTSFCGPGLDVRLSHCNGYAVVDVSFTGGARTYFYDVLSGELSAILCVQDPAQSVAGRTCNGTAHTLCATH